VLGQIVKSIKTNHPEIVVQYHGHTGPGFSVASMLEVAKAGGDVFDVAMEPLSWGMVHPDVITISEMFKAEGFKVPEINMKAYMEARRLTQSFMDDFLGYFIDPRNRFMSSLLVGCGLPGGMMGSLMADLKGVHAAINSNLKAQGKAELNEDELLVQLFDEVKYIWPKLGNPPLVTPFSQYVKNVALMNVFAMSRGGERWSMIDANTWDMILGKAGQLPGKLDPEIIELAKSKNLEFFTGNPQDNYPNVLPQYIKEMEELGWDRGQDDEELFEFAMHDKQYREFKSGEAKRRFNKELEEKIAAKMQGSAGAKVDAQKLLHPNAEPLKAPVAGRVLWELSARTNIAPAKGKKFKQGEFLCGLQTNHGIEEITAPFDGVFVEVKKQQGQNVELGGAIAIIDK
jgi:pyruvate carboxylase subunit B